MEKCNCNLCERREFFSKFDKNGKYTGETETLSIYEELVAIHLEMHKQNVGSLELRNRLVDKVIDRVNKFDNALIRLGAENSVVYEEVKKLREELY
ncbi:hypothetical protein [Bacillus phage Anath]|uniref:Uncharacterized protein n=1 Tax=Bacillus phage Anath TaxID=2108114 RepID=A0A2P1JUL3_9CAUD|nr:hypothetical protein [Bacillus phage Anath]